ncbi:hypothetical protein CRENBAI_005830 [Crenichthys baileyi]|uniref:Uncharacterized protein n=1 Tax=Crenichthys baileyi TaxID=28760 RepID=A0AAV9QYA3_9TELE
MFCAKFLPVCRCAGSTAAPTTHVGTWLAADSLCVYAHHSSVEGSGHTCSEVTSDLVFCLTVMPSWVGPSAELLLPRNSCSLSIDDTFCSVFQFISLSLLDTVTESAIVATNFVIYNVAFFTAFTDFIADPELTCSAVFLLDEATKEATVACYSLLF